MEAPFGVKSESFCGGLKYALGFKTGRVGRQDKLSRLDSKFLSFHFNQVSG